MSDEKREGYGRDRLLRREKELMGAVRGLRKALKGQMQMRDTAKPTKLVEHMAWRDNDDLADKWAKEALDATVDFDEGEREAKKP